MVAPVVVKPEIDSNTASMKLGIVCDSHRGRHPATDSTIQESAVAAKPSLRYMTLLLGFLNTSRKPSTLRPAAT